MKSLPLASIDSTLHDITVDLYRINDNIVANGQVFFFLFFFFFSFVLLDEQNKTFRSLTMTSEVIY